MPLSEVEVAEGETPLTAAGGLVTHPIRVHLGLTQAQILLVAGTAVALMVVVHLMIGNVRMKFKEISRFKK